ncbi:MAG: class I SAM-dependent methyltransferase [bacterium]|nr:class I SAM-dependent methyltransferase [bacterium]
MEWYPTPSHLVKRQAILDFIVTLHERDFLEVGCGAGDLACELAKKGFEGLGIDYSDEAVNCANGRLVGDRVKIEKKNIDDVEGHYSIVIACDVIEHYEDDVDFLKKLMVRLKPGGHLLVTVPAHMHMWGANDDFAGHIRRYERDDLADKMKECGLRTLFIDSYGVPICNIMKPFYDRAIGKQIDAEADVEGRTKKSAGMHLFVNVKSLFRLLFNDITMYPFYVVQKMFYRTELGTAYFLVAEKTKQK